ncbi:MAG: ribokinase [Anaerolineales bacterium]
MSNAPVTVVGSFAVGLTLRADRFPVKGETLIGRDFDQGPGGKGSNQAVQIARLGGDVEFVGLIGEDAFGDIAVKLYAEEGVGATHLMRTKDRNTGLGFIVLNAAGDNFILLDPGANTLFSPAHVDRAADRIRASRVVITQLEIPVATATHALKLGKRGGAVTILNPAPAAPVPPEAFADIDLVTPNHTELRILLGRAPDDATDSKDLCAQLLRAGVKTIVLTRGEHGALIVTGNGAQTIPAMRVNVVDTTGAGDAFSGTLAASLAEGAPLETAVRRAVGAGALACTALGVIPSLPHRADLDRFLNSQ